MINLVDLAGSEKVGKTGTTGDRLKEGKNQPFLAQTKKCASFPF